MLKRTFVTSALVFAMIAVILPTQAFARDRDDDGKRGRNERRHLESTNQFGVHVFEDNGKNRGMGFGLMYNGTVTAKSASGFTIKTGNGTTLTVDTTSAKFIQIPNTVKALADVSVGDGVHVTGIKSGSNVSASVVYYLPQSLKPAKAKGTVTAVNDNTITVQNKKGQTATVNMTADTQIVKSDKTDGITADVQVGSKVKAFGLWNGVLNVFNAFKIHLK